ncbi:MAG TPA: hypothetical protein VFH17_08005 [Coriobacteriia bacterium]|nr:hypothetical protein [Coriobacteriia bacterium]
MQTTQRATDRRRTAQARVELVTQTSFEAALRDALARHKDNRRAVAAEFKVNPSTVSRWCQALGIPTTRHSANANTCRRGSLVLVKSATS